MSRSTDQRPGDAGFSLVEVIVSLTLFMMLVVATLPALVGGLRSNNVARQSLQEKGFAQTELERMRNLPFHVAPAAGDYIDVLDRYFPTLVAPTSTPVCPAAGPFRAPAPTSAGYVAAGAPHCPWEPPGALFRTIRTESTDARLRGFVLVLDTQFLSDTTPPAPVTPPTGYHALVVGRDAPPTLQIGVTISVFRTDRTINKPMTTYAQIGRRDQLEPLVDSSVDATVLTLGSTTTDGLPLTVAGGLLGLDASLSYASRASAVVSPITTGLSTGQQGGDRVTVTAPPVTTVAATSSPSGRLGADCTLACWGGSRRSAITVSSAAGLPSVGSPTAPVQAMVTDMSNRGVTLGPGGGYRTDLGLTGSPVSYDPGSGIGSEGGGGVRSGVTTSCATSESGDGTRLVASGWLRTTLPEDTVTPSLVESCAVLRSATLAVLPTTFAPQGVLRLSLPRAVARCAVSGAAHTATASVTYSALVERWTAGGYVPVAEIKQSNTTDPLAGVDLGAPLGGGHGTLGDYIASWSSARAADVSSSAAGGEASVEVSGIVNLVTTPTRADAAGVVDPLSTVSLSLGDLSCHAADRR